MFFYIYILLTTNSEMNTIGRLQHGTSPPPPFSRPNNIQLNVLDEDMQTIGPHANQLILFHVTHFPAPIYKYQFSSIHTYRKALIPQPQPQKINNRNLNLKISHAAKSIREYMIDQNEGITIIRLPEIQLSKP